MIRTHRILVSLFVLLTMLLALPVLADDDPVIQAMADELQRTRDDLIMPGMVKPFFVSYTVEDRMTAAIVARNGALVSSNENQNRQFYIDVRVGDETLDNTYYVGSWRDVYARPMSLVEEDNYASVRHKLWLYTDAAYKQALENLARKKSYLASNPVTEQIADFSAVEGHEFEEDPVDLKLDMPYWQDQVRRASAVLQAYPGLQNWKVSFQAEASNKRFLNTDGSRIIKSERAFMLEVSATAQAEDGQRLTNFNRQIVVEAEDLKLGKDLQTDIKVLAEELMEMAAAPALDEYAGPVLFTDDAAGQFVSQLFAAQISPARPPVIQEDWMRRYMPQAKLVRRVNRRVMPDFLQIKDDPTRDSYNGVKLVGFRQVDDEGVPCQKIDLVKDGRLVTLPMSRRPCKKIKETNGHARLLDNQWTVPAVSNLFVEGDKALSDGQLLKELRQLAKDFGNEYGLLVKRLDQPDISNRYRWSQAEPNTAELTTNPVVMYKVYVKDGRLEPVRGLAPDEITVRTLRDIISVGDQEQVYNCAQKVGLQDVTYSASIITPSILVEEAGYRSATGHEPQPISESPLAAK